MENISKSPILLVVLIAWVVVQQVVLIIGGFGALWRRGRLLGVFLGLLLPPVIPPIYAIADFVSRQFSSASKSRRLTITVAAVVVWISPIILLDVLVSNVLRTACDPAHGGCL